MQYVEDLGLGRVVDRYDAHRDGHVPAGDAPARCKVEAVEHLLRLDPLVARLGAHVRAEHLITFEVLRHAGPEQPPLESELESAPARFSMGAGDEG